MDLMCFRTRFDDMASFLRGFSLDVVVIVASYAWSEVANNGNVPPTHLFDFAVNADPAPLDSWHYDSLQWMSCDPFGPSQCWICTKRCYRDLRHWFEPARYLATATVDCDRGSKSDAVGIAECGRNFTGVRSVAFDPFNRAYVLCEKDTIVVMDASLSRKFNAFSVFSVLGGIRRQGGLASKVAVNQKGNLFVLYDDWSVAVFQVDGTFVMQCKLQHRESYYGHGFDDMAASPSGSFVCVSEGGGGVVHVFGTDGRLLHHVAHDKLARPCGLAFDRAGNLFVCDSTSRRVHIFRLLENTHVDGGNTMESVLLRSFDPLLYPERVCLDYEGKIFVGTSGNESQNGEQASVHVFAFCQQDSKDVA